jgi:hypothetical protein
MKSKQLNTEVAFADYDEQIVLSIRVGIDLSKEISLLLVLLREDLEDGLELKFENYTLFIKKSPDNTSKCLSINRKKGVFKGLLSMNALEYLLYFLLKYYRDGSAESEHIDIDFELTDNSILTLTVKAEENRYYSSEEMKRMLGL